jgi:GT2 family glycosyltransferase
VWYPDARPDRPQFVGSAGRVSVTTDVSILIVNFNTGRRLADCLASLGRGTGCRTEVIVVDNASPGDDLTWLARDWPSVPLIVNSINLGFAAAVNQAARLAQGRHLLLLNPDTRVPDNAIDLLVALLDSHQDIGACGPRIVDATGATRRSTYRYITLRAGMRENVNRLKKFALRRRDSKNMEKTSSQPPPDGFADRRTEGSRPVLDVEAVQGCALMVRADVFRQLGGFDDRFFLYGEDIDFCRRLGQAGWRVVYVPQVTVEHAGAASANTAREPMLDDKLGRHYIRSYYLLLYKAQGPWAARALRMLNAFIGAVLLADSLFALERTRRAQLRSAGRLFAFTSWKPE